MKVSYPAVPSSGQTSGTSITYLRSPNNANLVDAMVDRAGNATHYTYDNALRQIEETNSLGGITSRTYDALGRLATQTDAAGNTTAFEYDLFDQPVKTTYPDNVPGTHERIGTMAYDNRGKLVTRAGAGDYPLSYTYDAVGNLASMIDANSHTTTWSYTDRNQVGTKTYADGTKFSYTYDSAGRLKTRKDAIGRTTTYMYNALGMPTTITYPSDPAVSFTYDQQGRRLTMTDGSGITTWTYDASGRMTSETQGRSRRTLNYGYDAFGQRISLNVGALDSLGAPLTGTSSWQTSYGYDNAGRLHTVLDGRLPAGKPYVYGYAANSGLVSSITSPTGLTTNKQYDQAGRLVKIAGQRADGTTINSFTYTYDAAGQRVNETALDYQQAFTYDAQRQLTQAAPVNMTTQRPNYQFAYDGIGNRLTAAVNAGSGAATTSYIPNVVNQYSSITGVLADTPGYDANGNTTSLNGRTLRCDEENRLVQVSDATHTSIYVYDGLGRRVERQEYVNGNQTADVHCVYDDWRPIEELDANFATLRSYTRGLDLANSFADAGGIGGVLSIAQPTGTAFTAATYFYDGNGNVTDLLGDDGSTAAHYAYSPFGERLVASGSLTDVNPFQFSTKERDTTTGFYYYGYRFYDPIGGRWLSRDPIGEDGGMNVYGMVDNDPISSVDFLGLFNSPGVHGDIMSSALNGSFSDEHIQRLIAGSNGIDLGDYIRYQMNKPYNLMSHFDGIQNPQQLNANWADVHRRMGELAQQIAEQYCANKTRAYVDALLHNYGGILHSVQDFYAHSNFVEQFDGLYDPNNPAHQNVISGITLNQRNYAPYQLHGKDNATDPGMNKDSKVRPNFGRARTAAIAATQQNWQQMQEEIRRRHAQLKSDGKCCVEIEEILKWFTGR